MRPPPHAAISCVNGPGTQRSRCWRARIAVQLELEDGPFGRSYDGLPSPGFRSATQEDRQDAAKGVIARSSEQAIVLGGP